MTRPEISGLRTRLLLLVLLSVAPAFVLISYQLQHERDNVIKDARADVELVAKDAANQFGILIGLSRQLLISLSQTPELQLSAINQKAMSLKSNHRGSCDALLAKLIKLHPRYLNIGVIAMDGTLACSALPHNHNINLADRFYFRQAIDTHKFSVGDYQIGRATGKESVNIAYPVMDGHNEITAVLFVAIDLEWMGNVLSNIRNPDSSSLCLVSRTGSVLSLRPHNKKQIGKTLKDSPLGKALFAHNANGSVESVGPDGVSGYFGFATMLPEDPDSGFVIAGIEKAPLIERVNRAFRNYFVIIGGVALLVLALGWWGAGVLVLRRVSKLTGAAERLGAGDLDVRTGLASDRDELGSLARSFDNMAENLQAKTQELRRTNRALLTLSASNQTLLHAEDEQTLLREMCRVVVEKGGYRGAWVGYAEHDEDKTVRVVAHHGVDDNYVARVRVSWGDTDTGRGPAGTTIRTGNPTVVKDMVADPRIAPWREELIRLGYASAISLPLRISNNVFGVISLYSADVADFGDAELRLLSEMADDLAFGIDSIRHRERARGAEETIRRLAYFDPLTGLANRIQLSEHLVQAIAAAGKHNRPLALLTLNIIRFRDFQHGLGYHRAEKLLLQIVERIQKTVIENELIARLGEDKFAILMPQGNTHYALTVARKVLKAMREPFRMDDLILDVRATIGAAFYPVHGTEPDALILRSGIAVQDARQSGDDYGVYAGVTDQESPQQLVLISQLRHAINSGGLVLHYQPKVDIQSGRVCGAEALVRWQHPEHGMIPPAEFIPLAEHTGLIKPLTYWVIDAAMRQCVAWRKAGLALPVAVNLSVENLRDPELLNTIKGLFATWGLPPECLQIEITESTLMENPKQSLEVLNHLKDMGMQLFIDDFGTGYSSLGYLAALPVLALKIDRSFIIRMVNEPDHMAIVSSTISLAHSLKLKVVAEGVDAEEQALILRRLNCDEIQGYLYSPPLAPDKFQEWLANFEMNGSKPKS